MRLIFQIPYGLGWVVVINPFFLPIYCANNLTILIPCVYIGKEDKDDINREERTTEKVVCCSQLFFLREFSTDGICSL